MESTISEYHLRCRGCNKPIHLKWDKNADWIAHRLKKLVVCDCCSRRFFSMSETLRIFNRAIESICALKFARYYNAPMPEKATKKCSYILQKASENLLTARNTIIVESDVTYLVEFFVKAVSAWKGDHSILVQLKNGFKSDIHKLVTPTSTFS